MAIPVYTGKGSADRSRAFQSMLDGAVRGKNPVLALLVQLIENAYDAKASSINILLKPNRLFGIIDNGHGFHEKDVDAFGSLFRSPKVDDHTTIGQNCTGRTFAMLFARLMRVYTVSKRFPKGTTFSVSYEDFEAVLGGDIEVPCNTGSTPKHWNLTDTGALITLEKIENWKKIPKIGKIIKTLANYLHPNIAAMVTINGKPLEPRVITGKIITQDLKVNYLEGSQNVRLYIPEKTGPNDVLRLGGYDPIMYVPEWARQVREIQPELYQRIPEEMLVSGVYGDIYIPELNQFRHHDGSSFQAALYDSNLLERVIDFLDEEVRPIILEQLPKDDKPIAEAEKLAQELCDRTNPVYGFDPDDLKEIPKGNEDGGKTKKRDPSNKPDHLILVTPRRPEILQGESITFEIEQTTGTSGNFTWDATNSGGKINHNKGREVIFTANQGIGRFSLIVYDTRKPSRRTEVPIRIVASKPLSISPRQISFSAGKDVPFRVVNYNQTGILRWELSTQDVPGLCLLREEGTATTVHTTVITTPGTYTLTIYDESDPENLRAEASFTVSKPPEDLGKMLKIEDRYYQLDKASNRQSEIVRVERAHRRALRAQRKGTKADVLYVNYSAELLTTAPAAEQPALLLKKFVAAHLLQLISEGDEELNHPRAFEARMDEIITTINSYNRENVY